MKCADDSRKPGDPLRSPKAEQYAQLRAKGIPAREAGEELGLLEGKAYMQLERTPEHRARVAELKAAEDAPMKLSLDWLASQLNMNVVAGRASNQIKASTEALVRLADLYRENREHFDSQRAEQTGGGAVPETRAVDRRSRLTAVPAIAKESA